MANVYGIEHISVKDGIPAMISEVKKASLKAQIAELQKLEECTLPSYGRLGTRLNISV